MLHALTLRRWLWRVNAVLALVVLWVAWQAVAEFSRDQVLPEYADALSTAAPRVQAPEFSPDEIRAITRAWVRWGSLGDRRLSPVAEPLATPAAAPPLRAYEIVCWIRDAAGPDTFALRCKDPAFPEAFYPREGRPDRGVAVEEVRVDRAPPTVTIRRGDDVHTFDLSSRAPDPVLASQLRIGPASAREDLAGAGRTSSADVKLVAFHGPTGAVIGARVMGLRSDSLLARSGLKRGSVVMAVNGRAVGDPVLASRYLADVRRGDQLLVFAPETKSRQVLALTD